MKTSYLKEALKQFPMESVMQPQEEQHQAHTHYYPEGATSCIPGGIEDSWEDELQLHPMGLQDRSGLQAPCREGQVGMQFLGQHRVVMRGLSSGQPAALPGPHFDTMSSDIRRLGARVVEAGPVLPTSQTLPRPGNVCNPASSSRAVDARPCVPTSQTWPQPLAPHNVCNPAPSSRAVDAIPCAPTLQTLRQARYNVFHPTTSLDPTTTPPSNSPSAVSCVVTAMRERAFAGLGLSGCTTVAIWNLPKQLTQIGLIFHLNTCGFEGMFDFIYMPGRRTKHGMAFVNFKTTPAADEFYRRYHGKYWPHAANKPIRVTPADVQGFERNVQRFAAQTVEDSPAMTRPICLRS